MDNREAILQLCRFLAFASEEAKAELSDEIKRGRVDWERVVSVANAELLTPALYHALRSKGLLEGTGDTQLNEFLQAVFEANRLRNEGIQEQIEDIQAILAQEDIVPLVLKGGAVVTEGLYPDDGIRVMNDLDIMIEPSRFEVALRLLKEGGYREFGRELNRWHHHTPRMNKAGYPAAIEPHFRIVYDRDIEYIPYTEETTMPSRNPRFSNIRVLTPHWHLYHAFIHAAIVDKHHQRWILGLRYLYDFAMLSVSYKGSVDWKTLYEETRRWGHHKIFEDYVYLANQLLDANIPLKTHRLRGAWHLKRSLWQTTLVPETSLYKFYEAFVDRHEIYGYESLKKYYGLTSKRQYPWALMRYVAYHGKKHLFS